VPTALSEKSLMAVESRHAQIRLAMQFVPQAS
jgi:hypothetical protein